MVLVAAQLSVLGSYLPPRIKRHPEGTAAPDDHFTAGPHCCVISSASGRFGRAGRCPSVRAGIISAAGVQIADTVKSAPDNHFAAGPDCCVMRRAAGALVVLVAVQLSVLGSYLPPVFEIAAECVDSAPDDHFAASSRLPCDQSRASGALVVLVAVQLSVLGSYLPPVFKTSKLRLSPPQTIISLPVHTAVVSPSGFGRVSGAGSCPTIRARDCICRRCSNGGAVSVPPQTIISVPVHTAV